MKPALKTLALSFSLLSFHSFAGDGGFTNYSCLSGSGRTIVNIFSDNFSGSTQPDTVKLIIDGQLVEYKSSSPGDRSVRWEENTLVAEAGNGQGLTIALGSRNGTKLDATLRAGYYDPRTGTDFQSAPTPDVSLKCVVFHQEP